jgi:hypothetical protein
VTTDLRDLPEPGDPFQIGETVAFFPAEFGPTSPWLGMGYAVIEGINADAETCEFRSVEAPFESFGQGMENIVRPSASYLAWRAAWEAAFERTGSEEEADEETEHLRVRVLAEHPIHGRGPGLMPGRHLRD